MNEPIPFLRRYEFRLYPTPEQAARLHEVRMMMADLWNALKQRREDVYRREGRTLTFFDLTNEITDLRHQCPEWEAVPAITAHRVAKRLVDAYAAFFRRVKAGAGSASGYPKWQARARATSIPLGTMATTGWRLARRDAINPHAWRLHFGAVTRVRDPAHWIGARGILPAAPEDWRNGDILWRDGAWYLSLCVVMPSRRPRLPGVALALEFGTLDCFCLLDGVPATPLDLDRAIEIDATVDARKTARDIRWPRGAARRSEAYRAASDDIAAMSAQAARIRRNALHVWTARIVAGASSLAITTPAVRQDFATGRGDWRDPGAEVATVAAVNRRLRQYAVASAIQMLTYKAAEKGIPCQVAVRREPIVADLVAAGRETRRLRRAVRGIAGEARA